MTATEWLAELEPGTTVVIQWEREFWTATTVERWTEVRRDTVAKLSATGVKVGNSWYHRVGAHAGRSRSKFLGRWAYLRAPASAVTPAEQPARSDR